MIRLFQCLAVRIVLVKILQQVHYIVLGIIRGNATRESRAPYPVTRKMTTRRTRYTVHSVQTVVGWIRLG